MKLFLHPMNIFLLSHTACVFMCLFCPFCFQYPLSNCKLLDGKACALLTSPSTMSHKLYCSINVFICAGIELSGRTDVKYRVKANTVSYYFLYFFRLNFLSDFFNIQRHTHKKFPVFETHYYVIERLQGLSNFCTSFPILLAFGSLKVVSDLWQAAFFHPTKHDFKCLIIRHSVYNIGTRKT